MRVLVVSHNVFSETNNMGKTLAAYFSQFSEDNLAQFYIQSQIPTLKICKKYYRITDKEAAKSILCRHCGRCYDGVDVQAGRTHGNKEQRISIAVYQKARKRTPLVYLIRNLCWKLSHWSTKQLCDWLDDFDPECVFFASGDYAFMYDISWKIAKTRNIPLYISCMDDYYFYNKNQDSIVGRWQHKMFMRSVRRAIAYSSKLFCICDKMSNDYSAFFGKPCVTVHTPASISRPLCTEKKMKISYLGNLRYQRDQQLIAIGRVLKSFGFGPGHIDVYSAESDETILNGMTVENGIVFHGAIGGDEVLQVMGESLSVIHTESFDEEIRQIVRYSVSTKIADSLASGTCIFAFGPEEVASIDYLKRNQSAVCCTKPEDLSRSLQELIRNSTLREKVVSNALALSAKNHTKIHTPEIIERELHTR